MSSGPANPGGADNYVLGPEIARGGMGYILEAEDTKLKRTVAAKLMVFEGGSDDGVRRRFLREAEILARLSHPNIVPIHDIVWEDGVPLFYTMKRVQGRTLQSVLHALKKDDAVARRDFTLDRLLFAFRKVCDAVAFAHSMGVIHRDLKPENVMIGEFGEVLVMDWGLAKMRNDEGQRPSDEGAGAASGVDPSPFSGTLAGTVMGTPQYMSPEQARGEVESLDEQSDVFSLGGILYAIATLHPPVEGKTVAEMLEKVRAGAVTPPTSYGSSSDSVRMRTAGSALDVKKTTPLPHVSGGRVPSALSAVVMKAMQVEKGRRYADVAALAADVEAFQGGFATKAEEAGALKQLRLLMMRHKAVTALLAAIFALSIFFIVRLLASERKATHNANVATENEQLATRRAEETRRALAVSQLAVAEAAFRNADRPSMVAALDSVPETLRDQRWSYLSAKRDASLGVLKQTGHASAIPHRPGHFIIASTTGSVELFDARSGSTLWRVESNLRGSPILAVSEDGERIAFAEQATPILKIFRTKDGAEEKSLPIPFNRLDNLTFSPDGQRMAVVQENGPNSIGGLLNVADGSLAWKQAGIFNYACFSPDGSRVSFCSTAYRFLLLLDCATGAVLKRVDAFLTCTAKSPDGTKLALGLYTGDVLLLDMTTGAELRRARLHTGAVSALAWTTHGHLLSIGAEGEYEGTRLVVRLWETTGFSVRGTFLGIRAETRAARIRLAFDPHTGESLVSDLPSQPIQHFRIPVDIESARITGAAEQGWATSFLSDAIMLGRKEYALARYDVSNPRQPQLLPPPLPGGCLAVGVHRTTGLVALASRIGDKPYSTKIFETTNDRLVERRSIPITSWAVCADFTPDATRLLLATLAEVSVLHVATGEPLFSLKVRCDQAAFVGDGTRFAAIVQKTRTPLETRDEVTLFDSRNGQPLSTTAYNLRLNALAVSPDRTLLAIGGDEQVVRILDAATLQERTNFRAHDLGITALAFHPTRPIVATGSNDGSVKLWNYETATLERTFLGFDGAPVMLAFSPSGHLLSVESQEHTARIFELGAGPPVAAPR